MLISFKQGHRSKKSTIFPINKGIERTIQQKAQRQLRQRRRRRIQGRRTNGGIACEPTTTNEVTYEACLHSTKP
jgi:hypothetical protein